MSQDKKGRVFVDYGKLIEDDLKHVKCVRFCTGDDLDQYVEVYPLEGGIQVRMGGLIQMSILPRGSGTVDIKGVSRG